MLSVGGGGWSWRGACQGGGEGRVSVPPPSLTTMLYYSLEPQFSALIFSVSARHERISFLPDALACYAHGPTWTGSDLLAYAHTCGVQLAALGDHYTCLLTQVRAGSVIFLVGVGSLVCWKLWEHWRAGGGCAPALLPPPPSPPDSATSARQPRPTRGILASLLEEDLVENPDDFEDEDPAFIHGKYFGPSSPCDDTSLISDVSEPGSEVQAKHYLADASASYAHGDEGVVSSSEASLPTDEDSDDELCDGNSGSGGSRRVVRRRHRASRLHRRTPATTSATQTQAGGKRLKENGLVPACHPVSNPATCHPMQDNWPSSESSPDSHPATRHRATRHHPPQPLSPDTEDMVDRRQRLLNMPQNRYDGSTLGADNRNEEEEEVRGMAQSVSSASLADLMEKLRQRAQRPSSLSRDNSVASSLSELLTSPLGSRCFPLKREDSVCSNMSGVSDITASECSEASLEVSMREDLAASTLTCLDDIEHELHDLKSSMLEMNQEVTKFTSRPDPYTFKTTYSDYSMGSGESRPPSALEVPFSPRSRLGAKVLPPTRANVSSDVENPDSDPYQQASEASGSMEWDSPQHGWSSSRPRPVSLPPTLPSHTTLCSAPQDDTMPSLEWDNGCLNQYSEENSATRHNTLDDVFHASTQERYQLLPDHSSLELDLEEELQSPQGTMAEWDLPPPAPMTTSVDSAIHSGTGSRSTSSSPIPPGMNRSLLSSSGLASSCEISPATPDSESSGWGWWERRGGPGGDWGSKVRHYWSSEESGFMDTPDAPQQPPHDTTAHALLSPLHEIKEKEGSESSSSTPQHQTNSILGDDIHSNTGDIDCTSDENSTVKNSAANENEVAEAHINKNLDNNHINNNFIMGNKSSATRGSVKTATDNQVTNSQTRTLIDEASNNVIGNEGPMAVGPKMELAEYAGREWQGNTSRALIMRQGYAAIPGELTYTHLRCVRGDNYCGVRAAVYQILSLGLPPPPAAPTYTRLATHLASGATWLKEWTFARRLKVNREGDILDTFRQCLDTLESLGSGLAGCENRENVVCGSLNGDPSLDVRVCEAVKLHMLAAALDLHAAACRGEVLPLFAMIMFARHSSPTPRLLLTNHLNPVGDTAGLEQIEMFLLGWALRATVRVVRPGSYGADDYICYYPDTNLGVWPQITLVAEDDRHYNVLVK